MLLRRKIPKTEDVVHFSFRRWLSRAWTVFIDWHEPPLAKHSLSEPQNLPYFSEKFNFHFAKMADYWEELGKREALVAVIARNRSIRGFQFDEMMCKAVRYDQGRHCAVVLFNINSAAIGKVAQRLPSMATTLYFSDYVLIPAENANHACQIVSRVPEIFAEALAIEDGKVIATNATAHLQDQMGT